MPSAHDDEWIERGFGEGNYSGMRSIFRSFIDKEKSYIQDPVKILLVDLPQYE